jgi:sulfur carrier protein
MTDTRTTDIRTTEAAAVPTVAPDPALTVNGVTHPWTTDLTVAALVRNLLGDDADAAVGAVAPVGVVTPVGTDGTAAPVAGAACAPTGVAVALDDAIVPRGLWASTPVPAGARVEVVTAVQGG